MRVASVEKLGTCQGHQDCLYTVTAFPGEGVFYTSGADGMVVRWEADSLDSGEMVAKVNGTVYSVCPLPESGLLAVGQNNEGIHLIDPVAREELRSLKLTDSPIFDIKAANGHLYVACGDGQLVVVDLDQWVTVARIRISEKALRTLALDPVNGVMAVGGSDHRVRVLDLNDFQVQAVLDHATNSVFALSFTPDGSHLLSAGRDAHLRLYGRSKGYALVRDIIPHMYTVNHILFHPNGRLFATCSKDKSIRIWDIDGLRALRTIDRSSNAGHGTSVNRLLWMDGHRLVSVSDDRTASIWKLGFEA